MDRYAFISCHSVELIVPSLDSLSSINFNIVEKLGLVVGNVQTLPIVIAETCRFNCNHVTDLKIMLLIAQIFTPAADADGAH